MARIVLLLLAALSLPACKRGAEKATDPTPTKEMLGDVALIDYDSPQGAFTCRAPRQWGVHEDDASGSDAVTFSAGAAPVSIHILQYPNGMDSRTDPDKRAESFWEIDPGGKQPAIEKKQVGGKDVILFHQERPHRKLHSGKIEYMARHDYALVPIKGGFFEIRHSAPVDSYRKTLPVFEAMVRSFAPKNR
ncbi:MAG: hypothetical protein HY403_04190 [Elusimicrobia bacterium]|nr:hypothetical protein [Elusimicrobiota bacterium]